MQFAMRKKIFRLQANEKSFAAERFHRVDKNGDECPGKGGKIGGKVRFFLYLGMRTVGHARCPNESRTGYRLTFC